jgi:hypothetical protein
MNLIAFAIMFTISTLPLLMIIHGVFFSPRR